MKRYLRRTEGFQKFGLVCKILLCIILFMTNEEAERKTWPMKNEVFLAEIVMKAAIIVGIDYTESGWCSVKQ